MKKEAASCPGKSYSQWNFLQLPHKNLMIPSARMLEWQWEWNIHHPFSLHVRKDILHKQKQKKTTVQGVEAGHSFLKLSTQRRILFSPGLSVQELDWTGTPRKYSMLLPNSKHSNICQKGSLDTQDYFSLFFFFIPMFSSCTPLLFYKSKKKYKKKPQVLFIFNCVFQR